MDVRRVLHQTCLSLLVFIAWVSQASFGYAGQLCTKIVTDKPKQQKKVAMIKRIPASCSNWDRSWTWLTKLDCGTKYKREYVSLPNPMVTYRLQYDCCENDEECLNAGWFGSEEKLMAIIIGSAVAALVILTVIIVISFLHRKGKLRCLHRSEENNHIYETADYETVDVSPPQYEEIYPKTPLDEKCAHDESTETKSEEGPPRLENTYVPFVSNTPTTPSAPFLDDIYSEPNNVNNTEDSTLVKKSCDVTDTPRQDQTDAHYINEEDCKEDSSDLKCSGNTGAKDKKLPELDEPCRNKNSHLELTNSPVSPSEKSNHSYELLNSPNANGTISKDEIC